MEDAARSLRGGGARITHSALFRAQLAETVLRLLDREIRVFVDFPSRRILRLRACTTLDDNLNDTDGLQSPRKRVLAQSRRSAFNPTAPFGLFHQFS